MAQPVVLYEIDDKLSIVTLNRPDKLNAISPELMEQLLDAFARADEEPATSVVYGPRAAASAPATTSAPGPPARSGAAIRSRRTSI